MLLASAAQILPVILGKDSGVICGQTNRELGSQLHSLKLGGLVCTGQRNFPASAVNCASRGLVQCV